MTSDAMVACAGMTFADAIHDLALRDGVDEAAVRDATIESGAYQALYNMETGLWAGGPDAFIDFYQKMASRAAGA